MNGLDRIFINLITDAFSRFSFQRCHRPSIRRLCPPICCHPSKCHLKSTCLTVPSSAKCTFNLLTTSATLPLNRPARNNEPIRLKILRNYITMFNHPMLLGQITFRKILYTISASLHLSFSFSPSLSLSFHPGKHKSKKKKKPTILSEAPSVNFFPRSLLIQSSCCLLLSFELLELMRPGTTRGMVWCCCGVVA